MAATQLSKNNFFSEEYTNLNNPSVKSSKITMVPQALRLNDFSSLSYAHKKISSSEHNIIFFSQLEEVNFLQKYNIFM